MTCYHWKLFYSMSKPILGVKIHSILTTTVMVSSSLKWWILSLNYIISYTAERKNWVLHPEGWISSQGMNCKTWRKNHFDPKGRSPEGWNDSSWRLQFIPRDEIYSLKDAKPNSSWPLCKKTYFIHLHLCISKIHPMGWIL